MADGLSRAPEPPSPADVRDFLSAYGLKPQALHARVLRGGQENLNLRLNVDGEALVLRRYAVTPPPEVRWELDVVDRLVDRGFPTAPVLRRRDGDLCGDLGGRAAALFRFVPGTRPRPHTLWAGEEVAGVLAALGAMTLGGHSEGLRSRTDRRRLERLLCVARVTPAGDPDLPALSAAVDRALGWRQAHADAWARLPRGVVHHDAHWDNVLLDGARRLTALLDFDEAYGDCLLTDVARLLRLWGVRRPGGGIRRERARRLLAAYERRRPLTAEERRWLPDFVVFTSLADAADYVARHLERDPRSRPVSGSWSYATYRRLLDEPGWRTGLTFA